MPSESKWVNAVVFALLLVAVTMLGAAVTGSPAVFAFGTVAVLGLLAGLAFVRETDAATWVPPIVATLVLAIAMTGLFLEQATPVNSVADTVPGFQAGTTFLIYGIWVPAFFTLGLGFAAVFHRLDAADSRSSDHTS